MPTLSHVNQEREISISLFFAVKSRFDAPVFMPRVCHGNVINDSSMRPDYLPVQACQATRIKREERIFNVC